MKYPIEYEHLFKNPDILISKEQYETIREAHKNAIDRLMKNKIQTISGSCLVDTLWFYDAYKSRTMVNSKEFEKTLNNLNKLGKRLRRNP